MRIIDKFKNVHKTYQNRGVDVTGARTGRWHQPLVYTVTTIAVLLVCQSTLLNLVLGIRCVVPQNYFTWEATRPLSECTFCSNLTAPIQLLNVTRAEFTPYAYTSKPIVVRGAFLHWPAIELFDFHYFKRLYATDDDVECQFLHFKSNFITLRDVFQMPTSRIENHPNESSWYVGFDNCNPKIVKEMRRHYPKPHFLPEDAELSHSDIVFMGYNEGASLHLDFINRLMWQAQLKGTKLWHLHPPPECQKVCQPFSFTVQPGDAVLVDTRVWYHATSIQNNEFSLSIHSMYS